MYKKNSNEILIIDVREKNEHLNSEKKIIQKIINIPLSQLKSKIKKIEKNKKKMIIVFCNSGARSKVAYIILTELGYTNVFDLGGINNLKYIYHLI